MKKNIIFAIVFILIIFGITTASAQLTVPGNGGCSRALVSEQIGLTDVIISYSRPAVRGREGKIWGGLIHTGFQYLGFGNGKDSPWRAGANENTTIEFSTDVTIEGQPLRAGKYGVFIAYGPEFSTLIFSSNTTSWGSFFYDSSEDVLRVNVRPRHIEESRERLTYEFSNETDSTAVISLVWEKLSIPFSVSTQLQEQQLASFDRELRGEKGFDPYAHLQVADYYLNHNVRLEDALAYINSASVSIPTFNVYMTKGQILAKLNRQKQADSIVQVAMNKGSVLEVHRYARNLLLEKLYQKAFDAFQFNYKRYPNTFTTNVGMARGYSAIGKPKDAIKYATAALPQAPDPANKKAVEDMIAVLKSGKLLG